MNFARLGTAVIALLGLGLAWFASDRLLEADAFSFSPNPLGIKRSPYGEVLAMAMQTPIESDWRNSFEIRNLPAGKSSRSEKVSPPSRSRPEGQQTESPTEDTFLARLDRAATERTNPKPPSAAHARYLRRQIEEKLRFAYELDPSHYANYNSYNLFLTTELGTRERTQEQILEEVRQFAAETRAYCQDQSGDPRDPLTSAAAATNVFTQILNTHGKNPPLEDLQQQLEHIDAALARHEEEMSRARDENRFELLSPMRRAEIEDRATFIGKIRDTMARTIERLQSPNLPRTAKNEP